MKQYKVFEYPSGSIEAVKQGWSWPAFCFPVIWAMVKKMWAVGVGVFLGFFVLGFISGEAGVTGGAFDIATHIVSIILAVIFGIYGNSWREANLVSRGFEHVDTLTAANPEGAIALYLKAPSTTALPVAAPAAASPVPVA